MAPSGRTSGPHYSGLAAPPLRNNHKWGVKDEESGKFYITEELLQFVNMSQFKDGLPVTYTLKSEPSWNRPTPFYKATNIKPRNE